MSVSDALIHKRGIKLNLRDGSDNRKEKWMKRHDFGGSREKSIAIDFASFQSILQINHCILFLKSVTGSTMLVEQILNYLLDH